VVDGQSLKIDASSGGTIFIGCVIVPQSNKKSLSTTVPSSKNGVYKVTFFDENYSFYFQDFPSKLPNSWILARAYSILSGVLDSRRVRFSKRYHDAPNTATKILSDKTMILFSHFIFAVPSYHLVLLALEFIHNFNFPLPFCSLHSLFVFQLYSSTANLIMVHIIL
jgi:hypothetical protein